VTQHTPVPWTYEAGSEIISVQGTRRLLVAQVLETAMLKDEPDHREADAAFIVRACNAHEELLEALNRLTTFAVRQDHAPVCEDIAFALAAIAKATGG